MAAAQSLGNSSPRSQMCLGDNTQLSAFVVLQGDSELILHKMKQLVHFPAQIGTQKCPEAFKLLISNLH